MCQPDVTRAVAYALGRLERELSPALIYHSLYHTRDEVVPVVEHTAHQEGVVGEPLLLLRTAAFYHDIGFVVQRQDHETIGVGIARETLPRFGYHSRQIDLIARMIMATKLPQSPASLLESILADADLDSLGRLDFMPRSLALRAELEASGSEIPLTDWYRQQIAFLSQHRYFTATARALRDEGKQHNIALLQSLLAAS